MSLCVCERSCACVLVCISVCQCVLVLVCVCWRACDLLPELQGLHEVVLLLGRGEGAVQLQHQVVPDGAEGGAERDAQLHGGLPQELLAGL